MLTSRRALAVAALVLAPHAPRAQTTLAQFTDPDRAAKLARAFPAIDSLFSAYATRNHIPGASWGIILPDDAGVY